MARYVVTIETKEQLEEIERALRRFAARRGDAIVELRDEKRSRGRPRSLSKKIRAHILEAHAAGESLYSIAARLEREGVPTASGRGRWHPSTVAAVVKAGAD